MRKLYTCLFYGLCVFTVAFSLYWMSLPKLTLPAPAGSETPPSSEQLSLAAQAVPESGVQYYLLKDSNGRVAVYRCDSDLLPENDLLRLRRGVVVRSERELDLLLEDLGN